MKLKQLLSKLRYRNQIKNSIALDFKVLNKSGKLEIFKLYLSKKKINQQIKVTKGIDIYEFNYFWELRNDLFKSIILKSFEPQIKEYLKKIHKDEFIYTDKNEKKSLKVISMYYHFYDDEIYVFVEPNYDYYPDDKIKRLELYLKYDSNEFEKSLIQILDLWQLDYSSFTEDNYYESIWDFELEIDSFFLEFMFKHWSEIKKETNSDLIGFITYATRGLYTYDLDNKSEVRGLKNETKKYLENKNIYLKSELS
ncbi:hypothetical protein CSC81_13495 [Tenacibaculum discolor]|uniref:Uncharacterized protein n=1 Tax=Tenacibaculum discolor TaxID=361581 RepID=A0A2G1BRP1_9FLAO|nr:hypothetical protein [Tenacibaculum discolor]MDP2542234.1 hypothetical protein [Tenacibaculum discolor]PHN96733.1 hypothetical protein CSC81_13495 [Tenacibaculum discolor]PHO01657.1 hypothetical protein CSC82_22460 [Rhodobacteraceae bacterium 4F10]